MREGVRPRTSSRATLWDSLWVLKKPIVVAHSVRPDFPRGFRLKMQLEDIALEEIEPFLNSLGKEREELGIPLDHLLAADYVCGVRVNGNLAGLGGYVKSFRFIPSSFDVVAPQYQGRGLGHTLFEKHLRFARKHYSYAVTSIGNLETHPAAVVLCHSHGLRSLYKGSFYISFNARGKLLCKLLSFVYAGYYLVLELPLGGRLLKTIYRFSQRRRSPL